MLIRPSGLSQQLLQWAGRGSLLHQTYRVYLDAVTIVTVPEDYEERLTELFAGQFQKLRLFALDAYDVALSKLERNLQRDRDDVKFLARMLPFDLDTLQARYHKELRPYLT